MEHLIRVVVTEFRRAEGILQNQIEEQSITSSMDEGNDQQFEVSPGASKYWIPLCEQELKPYVGMSFTELEHGIKFYKTYASRGGFDVRIYTTKRLKSGKIRVQLVVCNREGYKNTTKNAVVDGSETHTSKRRRVSKRVGCKARVVFEYDGLANYIIKSFEERHNHSLSSEAYKHFLKSNRKLNFAHQNFVMNCIRANVGPAKTHRLYKEMVGSYGNVGALHIDFKNFKRELKAYICGKDAQIIINKFLEKVEVCPSMKFEYVVDESEHLTRLFWADPTSRRNYDMFGDVISFDATYDTNRYKMVFTPFTGVDNHKRCVTFAAGLILKEDVESYVWLFSNFLKAMGREPNYIVTDQDPAMRNAIQIVFQNARHRLCMWHIMEKVSAKVGNDLFNDENFMNRLNGLVWNSYIEPNEFDEKWKILMHDFGLSMHTWFCAMFEIRQHWIPAYFRDVKMGGLLRTTSRSESANSWFGHFTNPQVSLVEFFMHFDSAMDAQRHAVDKLNSECESTFPACKTPLAIEQHAASVYTINVFSDVSSEIESACYKCTVVTINVKEGETHYTIRDGKKDIFEVIINKDSDIAQCSCKMFETSGLLCRHIFMVFKDNDRIPDKYLLQRWTKAASQYVHSGIEFCSGAENDECRESLNKLWFDFHYCVGLAEGNKEQIERLSRVIAEQKDLLLAFRNSGSNISNKNPMIQSFVGSSPSLEVDVLPPIMAKNKGSGSRIKSRIQSSKEKAIKESMKRKRRCGSCGEVVSHNSRTCPKKNIVS